MYFKKNETVLERIHALAYENKELRQMQNASNKKADMETPMPALFLKFSPTPH